MATMSFRSRGKEKKAGGEASVCCCTSRDSVASFRVDRPSHSSFTSSCSSFLRFQGVWRNEQVQVTLTQLLLSSGWSLQSHELSNLQHLHSISVTVPAPGSTSQCSDQSLAALAALPSPQGLCSHAHAKQSQPHLSDDVQK